MTFFNPAPVGTGLDRVLKRGKILKIAGALSTLKKLTAFTTGTLDFIKMTF